MMRIISIGLLSSIVLLWTIAPASAQRSGAEPLVQNSNGKAVGQYHALFIGVNKYPNRGLQDLKHPISDARRLRDVLIDNYTFAKENITLLENPDEDKILTAFEQLASTVGPEDNVLIFYAGHGYWDEAAEQGYWLPSDASNTRRSRWISNSTIGDEISRINSRHTLLISDACFAGSLLITRNVNSDQDDALDELHRLQSRKAMTSGALTEVPDKSYFIDELIGTLNNNQTPRISTRQLFSKFELSLINNSPVIGGERLRPLYGEIRDAGDKRGEFLFVSRKVAPAPLQVTEGSAEIVVRSNQPGRLLIDSENEVSIPANLIEKIKLQPGSHILTFIPQGPFKGAERLVDVQQGFSEVVEFVFEKVDLPPYWENGVKMELQLIQPGSFQMGSERGDFDEKPVHTVHISRPFYMGRTEVTQSQYEAVMGSNPSALKGSDHPVESVSWGDAQEYIRLLNEKENCDGCYRLPTEAEWEYVCRAGSMGKYSHGDSESTLSSYAWYGKGSTGETHPVGTKQANRWDIYDMSGNVWEWVSDYYDAAYYVISAQVDPQGQSIGERRVLRGGSFWDAVGSASCSHRGRYGPGYRVNYVGFRVVYSLSS